MSRSNVGALKLRVHQNRYRPSLKSNSEGKSEQFSRLYFLMMICLLTVVQSVFVKVPQNKVVLRDGSSEQIVMPCKSDQPDPLKWYVKKNPNSEKVTLYNGYYLRPDAKSYCTVITDEPGENQLLLKSTAEIAQTYICLEPGTLAETSADLIWIGSLMCIDKSTEELINLICDIEFRGNWAPTMEWTEHSKVGKQVVTVESNTTTIPNQRVTSTLVLPVQDASRNYTCTTTFDISGKPHETTATNVPDYETKWSTTITIKSQDEMAETSVASSTIIVAMVLTVNLIAVIVVVIIARIRHNEAANWEQQIKYHQNGLLKIQQCLSNSTFNIRRSLLNLKNPSDTLIRSIGHGEAGAA